MGVGVFDTVILGGTVVRPGSTPIRANLGIAKGMIAAISAPDVSLEGKEIVDAWGLYIFPGAIEPHAHWGLGDGLNDFITESRSAALGGVTTVLTFLREPRAYDQLFEAMRTFGEEHSVVDFGFHAVLMTEDHLRQIPHYVNDFGISSFKFYLTYRGEDAAFMGFEGIDDGFMYECFQEVARHRGALVIAHCENIEIVHRMRQRLQSEGRDDMEAWQASRPVVAEVEGIQRAMLVAEATSCRLNVLHLTSRCGLEAILAFRRRYPRIYAEVCHLYLACNVDNVVLTNALKVKPPLRTSADSEALWEGVANGSIDTVASDHVPRRLEAKAGSVWGPYTGCPGTATLLPVLLSEGYHKRGVPLGRIAEVVSANAARLYGLYPRKGALEIGSDADLTLVDLETEKTVRAEDLGSFADYSPYEGRRLKGWPVHTLVRGQWVMRDGKIVTDEGIGSYLPRSASG